LISWQYSPFIVFYVYIWQIPDFCVFCTITVGSARSQRNFLDKQSETCQKDYSYKKCSDLKRKLDLSKFVDFRHTSQNCIDLFTFMTDFRLLCFLYHHNGLCEIPEKFSWQTIWDLSERLQLQEIYRSEEKIRFIKIAYFRDNIAYISHICVYFDWIMKFVCFVKSQWALRDPRKIFLRNNLRLVRKIPATRNLQIWGENYIFQNRLISWQYSLYFSHLHVFWLIYEFCVFCTITMGSARSQKKFIDKQSETCQKDYSYKKSTDLRRKLDLSKSPNFVTI